MSDILQVLDRQTAQTEALIARLTDRLDKAGQLREMEQGRQQLAETIARLEGRMDVIDTELTELRQLTTSDAVDVEGAAARFQVALTAGNIQPQATQATPLPPPPVAPAVVADDDFPVAPALPTDEATDDELVFDGADVTDVLGDFAAGSGNNGDWSFGSGGSLFSDAEELVDDETADWWDQITEEDAAETVPAPIENSFMVGFDEADEMQMYAPAGMGAYPIPETPQLPQPSTGSQRKGFLGRFF